MERTSWVVVLIPVLYNNNQCKYYIIISLARGTPVFRATALWHPSFSPGETPIFRASTISPGGTPTFRATTPQGFGSLPNSLLRLWETPYATLLVFPALPVSRTLSNPARAGIPLWLGSSNTTSRTLSLSVWCLPEQTHYSFIIRHRSLALLRVRFINILYFGITQFTL